MIGCFDLMRRLVSASSQALASFPKVFNVDVSISGTTFWHETWIAHQKFRMILENYQALLWWIYQTGSFLSKVLKQSTLNQLQEQLQELGFKPGLQIRHFEKNSRTKKLITQGKNLITERKNSRIWLNLQREESN